jgi:UDP:flavonoid glycosyltransferase YjiC (YdhE family)
MRVLLAPHGTRGDTQPMLALAHALRARGHTTSFVAPANFVAWIQAHGFDAVSNGIDIEAVLQATNADLSSLRWQMRHLAELTATLFASVARASEHADLIVGAGVQMATASVAEWRKVPCASVAFCPCAVPSAAAPPPPIKTQTLPRWVNRLLWDVGGPAVSWALRSSINRARATLGLRGIDHVLSHLIGDQILVAADPDLGPLGDDAPEKAVATDAWVLDEEDAAIDPRVDAFLALNPTPVSVGFGSMVAKRVAPLAEQTIAAVRAVGRPVIIAGGWAGLDRHVTPADDILIAGALPHAHVFPRVSAVIHHGGAGTTTAAARAGVPQVILPHILDQYYWGHRIAQLGLGPRALPADLVTADVLADRVDAAVGDPAIRARAVALAPAIRARNGTTAAVEHLERLVATGAPSAQ